MHVHMITSTALRPYASTRSEPVECSNFEVHVKITETRSLALERSIEQRGSSAWWRAMGMGSFAFAGQPAVDHPAASRWHTSSKKNRPSWCLFPFRMATVTAFENSLGSGYPFASVPARSRKTNAVGNVVAETGTTERYFNAVDKRGPTLTWTAPARPSAAADSEERQICTTCLFAGERWIVLMLSPIMRDVQRQRCWKRGSGDGQRLSRKLCDYGTTERSFNAVERWGSTLTWTLCMAADSEERQICTTCLFAENVGLWKDDCLAFSHRGAHFCLRGGWGKLRGEIWRAIPQSNTKRPATKTTNSNCCDRAVAQVKQHIPEQPGERTASTEQISKKGIKLILKTIGNRKGDCAWCCSRWQTQPWENLQIAKHKSVQCAKWMTLICALQFADFLRLCLSPRTTSRTISFSISNSF